MARYRGGNTTGRALKFPREYYYPEALKAGSLTEQQMRQEYSRLRAIANKRLQRFEGTKYENSQTYLRNAGKYVPLAAIGSQRELQMKLVEVSRFVTAKEGSVSGINAANRKRVATFRERGLDFVNMENIQDFGEFMEWARDSGYERVYGSEKTSDVYGQAVKRMGIDVEAVRKDFEYYMENLDTLRNVPRARNPKDRTSEEYRSRIDRAAKSKTKKKR